MFQNLSSDSEEAMYLPEVKRSVLEFIKYHNTPRGGEIAGIESRNEASLLVSQRHGKHHFKILLILTSQNSIN